MLTEQSNVGREIFKHMPKTMIRESTGKEIAIPRVDLIEDFESIKSTLNEIYQMEQIQKDKESEKSRIQHETLLNQNLDAARSILECKDQPLLYIAALISWLTAGERANIMLTFITFASQVILRNPISMIGLGDADRKSVV